MTSNATNVTREMRAAFTFIEECATKDNNGMVFGGYLRDAIIKDYNTDKFMDIHSKLEKDERTQKYWDFNYHPETLERLLIPSDIDVSFLFEEDATNFIKDLTKDGIFYVTECKNEYLYDHATAELIKHTIYEVSANLNFSFLNKEKAIVLKFKVDVCVSAREPPFQKCDLSCNCLVKDKVGIRLSRDSGIFPEKTREYEKLIFVGKIVEMTIRKETYVTMEFPGLNLEGDAGIRKHQGTFLKRMYKAIDKNFTIVNIEWLNVVKDENQVCSICLDENSEISINKGSHFHKKCLFEFFENIEKFRHDEDGFFFNSPLNEKCYMKFKKPWENFNA